MRQNRIGAAALAALCSGVLISAQAQTPASPQTPTSPQQSQASKPSPSAVTTIVGCVYREADVPGRAPNVAERAGVLEDYILAEMSPTPAGTPGAGAPPAPTGTSGAAQKLGTMYKLEFAEDGKLRALVGKRVEVTGRVDKEAGDSAATPATSPATSQADKVLGRDRIDLAEFEVSSIRETAGACPATPAAK